MELERIRNIFCIGRNYSDHAKEMNAPIPSTPLVFLKPTSSLTSSGAVFLPAGIEEVHHELELLLLMGKNLKIEKLGVGVDVTARDLQADAKKKGEPWLLSKGQKTFAPIGSFVPFPNIAVSFELKVNGVLKQQGNSKDMIFSFDEIVKYLDRTYGLSEGDLIFTGTPKGVGPLRVGDVVSARICDVPAALEFSVKQSPK